MIISYIEKTLPKDWELAEFQDVAHKIMVGIASAATHAYRESGIPMIRNTNINVGSIDTSDILFIDPEYEKAHKNKRLKEGDIVTVRTGYPGVSAVVPKSLEDAQCFTSLITRPRKEKVLSKYLCAFINSPIGERQFEIGQAGGAQKNVNASTLSQMLVPLPSLDEQLVIIQTLSRWDRSIDLTESLIADKQERRTWLMQQLLTGKRRMPGFYTEWREVRLRDVFERVQRAIPDGEAPEVLSITAKTGFVSQKEKFSKVIAGKNLEKYVLIRRGEFSYNKGNSLTYSQGCVFRLKEFDEGAVPNVFLSFRAASPEVYPDFYSHLFAAGGLNHQLSRVINTGVRNDGLLNLNASDFFALKIPLPQVKEQERIAEVLSLANRELDLLRSQLDALREQKKGLMQQLLTGKIRVKC